MACPASYKSPPQTLRVLAAINPPWVFPCPPTNLNCSYMGGVEEAMLEGITRFLGLRHILTRTNVSQTPELLKMMETGLFDLLLPGIPIHFAANLSQGYAMSPTVNEDGIGFIARRQPSRRESGIFLDKVDPLILLFFLLGFVLYTLYSAKSGRRRAQATVLFLGLTIVLSVYSNYLAIFLSTRVPAPPSFSTYDELHRLLASRRCRLVTNEGLNLSPFRVVADKSLWAELGRRPSETEIRQRMGMYEEGLKRPLPKNSAELIQSSRACYIGATYHTLRLVLEPVYCGVEIIMPAGTDMGQYAWVLKDGPLARSLETLMSQGAFPDLYQREMRAFVNRNFSYLNRCQAEVPPTRALSPSQLYDVFLLVLVGSLLALLLLCAEFPTYHLANVVDDHEMEISHVIRGQEWLPSVPKHVQLYSALGWAPPHFAHLPLMVDESGRKLSKRNADVFVEHYKKEGYTSIALLNYVMRSGGGFRGGRDLESLYSIDQMVELFELDLLRRSPVSVDMTWMGKFNKMAMGKVTPESQIPQIRAMVLERYGDLQVEGVTDTSDEFIAKVLTVAGPRIGCLGDLFKVDFEFLWTLPKDAGGLLDFHDAAFCRRLAGLLLDLFQTSEMDWATLGPKLLDLGKREGLKKAHLMRFLRLGLSGTRAGPPMADVLATLGKESVLARTRHLISLLQ